MIDLTRLEQYRENNRIEAKKALGGLPHSIWETYSAFANTLGGIILLGVEEHKDKSLHSVDLPDPEGLVREFWDLVNDPKKASVNILTKKHVRIEEVNGDHIIVIEVPRAQRYYRPVYVDDNPVSGAYRRNGEGDYHCTEEELRAMYRDADRKTQDMLVLEELDGSVFCLESLREYRRRMALSRPNHVWESLADDDFLLKLGATGIGQDGKAHPTAAGLLMFGYAQEIAREYPEYRLEYRKDEGGRLVSSSGDWSGNVFDFYLRVCGEMRFHGKTPDDAPVRKALREALANCLINADYYGHGGIVVEKCRERITMANPGEFRVELADAKSGGLSDPRNGVMMKMFNLIDVGERAGSGIPNILYVWKRQGWAEPTITQSVDPNRIELCLPLGKNDESRAETHGGSKKTAVSSAMQKEAIIHFLTDRVRGSTADFAALLGVKPDRVRRILHEMLEEGIIVAEGENRKRTYRLKA